MQNAHTIENPLVETETLKRLEIIALVAGAASAIVGGILMHHGCSVAKASPSPTRNEVPCDMGDRTSACYKQNMQIVNSGPGMGEQRAGVWMTVGGTTLAVMAIGALAGTLIAANANGIPAIGAGMGAAAGFLPGIFGGLTVALMTGPRACLL